MCTNWIRLTRYVISVAIVILASGCKEQGQPDSFRTDPVQNAVLEDLSTRLKSAQTENESLRSRLRLEGLRRSYVIAVAKRINDLEDKLRTLRTREIGIVISNRSVEEQLGSLEEKQAGRMLTMLSDLDAVILRNRNSLFDLRSQLASAKTETILLSDSLKTQGARIEVFDSLLVKVRAEIEARDSLIISLTETVSDLSHSLAVLREHVDAGYYVVGSEKQLLASGVLESQGSLNLGLFTLGGTMVLVPGYNLRNVFTRVSIRETEYVDFSGGLDSKVLPPRVASSYDIRTGPIMGMKRLRILDRSTFWNDKYLIIVASEPTEHP